MQTYTHAVIGAALGLAIFPGDPQAQVACVAGSVAPDLVMIPQFLADKIAGRKPLGHQSEQMMLLKEMGHSLPLWSSFLFLMWYLGADPAWFALAMGGLVHISIDVFTHGTGPRNQRPFWDTDVTSMWPLRLDLRSLGVWEYRYDHGVLTPKPFEVLVLVASVVAVIFLWK